MTEPNDSDHGVADSESMIQGARQDSVERMDLGLLRRASGVLIMRILGALAALGASVVIGRTFGAFWTGTYFIAVSVVSIAVTLGRLGLDLPTMRMTSVAVDQSDWPRAHGVARKSLLVALIASSSLSVAILIAAPLIAAVFSSDSLAWMLRITGTAIVPMVLLMTLARLLMSIQHATLAEFLQRLGPSLLVVVGVLALSAWLGGYAAALAFSIAYWAAFLGALVAWLVLTPSPVQAAHIPAMDLLRPALPLLLASSMSLIIVWSDILMIGAMRTSAEAGIYGAATRVAGVVGFLVVAAGAVMGPRFARLFERDDLEGLAEAFRVSARWTGLGALGLSLMLIALAGKAMGLFGEEFLAGRSALIVLVVGQLVNSAIGLVGLVLAMSGHERRLMHSAFVTALFNVALNLLLIPRFGISGAAVATTASLALLSVINLVFVKRDLGIALLGS